MRARPHRTRPRLAWLAAAFLAAPAAAGDPPPPASDPALLLARAYASLYRTDCAQVLRLTSHQPGGRTISRRISIARKWSTPPPRALIRFLEPADVRGTSMLVIEREGRDADLFVHLPAFDRTRRMTAAQRFDSFFGTNLTYEDLEPKDVADFDVRALGREEVAGNACMRLEVRPLPGVESQYERTTTCIDPVRAVILWTEYHAGGRPLKRLESDPTSIRAAGDGFLPWRTRLLTHATGFETEIVIESHLAHADLPDAAFTIPRLELGAEPGADAALSGRRP